MTIRNGEKGVALVFTLFLMAALSAMAVSMMFLAQTETSASRNYRTMSQARYAGEAGVQRAIHYLANLSSTPYTPTVTGMTTTVSPVTYSGNPVVLSSNVSASNHPDSAVKAAFAALFTGVSMSVGSGATVGYTATATLLSARTVRVYGGNDQVIQTWRIIATGSAGPVTLPATVEVAAILERDSIVAETYAIFATGDVCGAITLAGGSETDSYDSTAITLAGSPPKPTTDSSGGSVGTNGNLTIGGNVTVKGNFDSPRTGVGNCSTGHFTALDENGQATVLGDRIQLPQAKVYPTPNPPSPMPGTGILNLNSTTCTSLAPMLGSGFPADTCVYSATGSGTFTIFKNNTSPIVWGNVQMTGGITLQINKGPFYPSSSATVNMNVNSWSLAGGATVALANDVSVNLNAAGTGFTSGQTVLDFTGGALTNGTGTAAFDSSKFQILYGGVSKIKLAGGTHTAATIYAPNADVDVGGGADIYGSVLSRTFTAGGSGGKVHYDRGLSARVFTLGNHVMSSFSWQKY